MMGEAGRKFSACYGSVEDLRRFTENDFRAFLVFTRWTSAVAPGGSVMNPYARKYSIFFESEVGSVFFHFLIALSLYSLNRRLYPV